MGETGWLLELIKQGGLAAIAAIALYAAWQVWTARLEDEKKRSQDRVDTERRNAEEKLAIERKAREDTRLMWEQTRTAIENNTRLVSAFMERFQVEQPVRKPRKRTVVRLDDHAQGADGNNNGGGGQD